MPSAFDRFATLDADKFVDPTLFGVAAVYLRHGEPDLALNVTFAEPTFGDALDQPGCQDTQPSCLATLADLPNARREEILVIADYPYAITEARPDGTGHVWLRLARAPGAILTTPAGVPLTTPAGQILRPS